MKKLLSVMLIIILFMGFNSRCKKEDKGVAPELPPQESMSIDFSNFTSKKKGADQIYVQKGVETSNWDFAATVVVVWESIINTALVVPVTTFKLATGKVPVFVSSNTWQWSYTATIAGVVYDAKLTGQITASDVLWEMRMTQEGAGGFTDFIWFNGTSKLDGTGGQWILFQSPASPVAMLQIDWTKTGGSIGTIKYTYVKSDSFKNSYIEYGLTTNPLNAYYTINYFNSVKFSDVNIEWSTATSNGRVKSIDYMGDSNWYCWDENKINITCP
jgi:hypothetical protein